MNLVPAGVPAVGGGIAWGDDGRIYFVSNAGSIQSVPAGGGTPTTVAAPIQGSGGYMWLDALPGGQALLLTIGKVGSPEVSEIAVLPTNGGPVRRLVKGTMARYLTSGHLVYTTVDGTMMAVRFDPRRLEIAGSPAALFRGVDVYLASASQFAVSRTGDLAWVGKEGISEIVRVDRSGAGGPIDPGWTGPISFLALAPDGSRLVVNTADGDGAKLWIKQLDHGPLAPFSSDGTRNVGLSWSPDGAAIAVLSNRSGQGQLWLARADGAKAAEPLPVSGSIYAAEWTADGNDIVAGRAAEGVGTELVLIRPGWDSTPRLLLKGPYLFQYPALSPDGRWLAYSSSEPGQDEVIVRPFPNVEGGKWQVSLAGGIEPEWAHSGRELFFRDGAGDLVVAEVTSGPAGVFRSGAPRRLFPAAVDVHRDGKHYAVTPDDRHLLLVRPVGGAESRLVMVGNFAEELTRKLPR